MTGRPGSCLVLAYSSGSSSASSAFLSCLFNSCRVGHILGNIDTQLRFLSGLDIGLAHAIDILLRGRPGPAYHKYIMTSLQWSHNERDGVPNHRRIYCLLNRLFRRRSKKTWKLRVTAFVRGIHRWPVNSPHKWPVTRKMFPFDDVIMSLWYTFYQNQSCFSKHVRNDWYF